ncbi:MAG: hypothetical protein R3E66_07290 [bacterium]
MALLLPVMLATALGVQFPLLSHYGVDADADAGMGVATLYVAPTSWAASLVRW